MQAVAECEWDGEAFVKEDFEKLLVARAALRIMVYRDCCANADTLRNWVDLHEGHNAGDTYLLVVYQGTPDTRLPLRIRHIIVRRLGPERVE